MRPFTRSQRLKYWFDNTMSAGTPALIAWLAVVTELFSPKAPSFTSVLLQTTLLLAGQCCYWQANVVLHRR